MAKAQRSAMAATGNHPVGLLLNILPEGDARTGGYTIVGCSVAIADGHALVVGIVGGLHLLGGEDIPKTHAQRNVLHVAGNGVQLAEQVECRRCIVLIGRLTKQRTDEAVRAYAGQALRAGLERIQLGRLIIYIVHEAGIGLYRESGRLPAELSPLFQFIAKGQHGGPAAGNGTRTCQ